MIDVGSEWRTFTNEKATKDPSRVGDAQNPLLNGGDLTTMISKVKGMCGGAALLTVARMWVLASRSSCRKPSVRAVTAYLVAQ